jgi:hypothetical protein
MGSGIFKTRNAVQWNIPAEKPFEKREKVRPLSPDSSPSPPEETVS